MKDPDEDSAVRIVVVDMPRLLRDIVVRAIGDDDGLEIVGQTVDPGEMYDLARRRRADVVILGCDETEISDAGRRLVGERPYTRLLAITRDGERTFLYELCPRRIELGEVATADLLRVIHNGPCDPGATRAMGGQRRWKSALPT